MEGGQPKLAEGGQPKFAEEVRKPRKRKASPPPPIVDDEAADTSGPRRSRRDRRKPRTLVEGRDPRTNASARAGVKAHC